MASSGTFFILAAIWITAGNAKNPFVKVECNNKNMAEHGHQSQLECVVKTTKEAANAVIRVVTWTKEGVDRPLLVFNRGQLQQQSGYEFAEPSWNENNMNISLLITKTTVADSGSYTCMVITDSGDDQSPTDLQVKATYGAPAIHSIPEKITQNVDSELICKADGGYPKGQLRWFDEHNAEWTKSAEMDVRTTDNGLFQLSSKLPLLRGSTFSKYTCVVFNASGVKEGSTTFELSPTPEGHESRGAVDLPSKIVAPVVVIGSLIVGLLFVLVYRRRSQKARRPSATPLMGTSIFGQIIMAAFVLFYLGIGASIRYVFKGGQPQHDASEFDVEEGCRENLEPEKYQPSQP